jgi:hypothetical protein
MEHKVDYCGYPRQDEEWNYAARHVVLRIVYSFLRSLQAVPPFRLAATFRFLFSQRKAITKFGVTVPRSIF